MWERLSQESAKDDDVEGRDAGPDGAVASSPPENIFKGGMHFGSKSDRGLVKGYPAAVHRQHELGTVIDGLVDESTQRVDACTGLVGGILGCVENKAERPEGERRKEGFARWVAAVERADAHSGVRRDSRKRHSSPFTSHRCRGSGKHPVAVRHCIASELTPLQALGVRSPLDFAHRSDDGSS